jgi:hypothetical protein
MLLYQTCLTAKVLILELLKTVASIASLLITVNSLLVPLHMAHYDYLAAPLVLSSPDNPLVPIGGFYGLRETAQLIREKFLVRNTITLRTEGSY